MQDGVSVAIKSVSDISTEIINPIIKLLIAGAVIYFLYGVVKFLIGSRERSDSQEAVEGKNHMLYGIIGIAITISAFGIVNLIANFVSDVSK